MPTHDFAHDSALLSLLNGYGVLTQQLLAESIVCGQLLEVKGLQQIDAELGMLAAEVKRTTPASDNTSRFRTPSIQPEDVEHALGTIEQAVENIGGQLQEVADAHKRRFAQTMESLRNRPLVARTEPYLEAELKQAELEFLQGLETLLGRLETVIERKAIDPRAPITPQIESDITRLRENTALRLERRLDKRRQEGEGVVKYVWVTQGDSRVRPTHAANHDKIFAWNNPSPVTGHPGDQPGCRCFAMPVEEDIGRPRLQLEDSFQVAGLGGLIRVISQRILSKTAKTREAVKKPAAQEQKPTPKKPEKLPRKVEGENAPKEGRKDTQWKFGKHKSQTKWKNQINKRNWTEEEITNTIKNGKSYKAPNKVNPNNGATRYQSKDGKYVVRDNKTKEILQVSDDAFIPNQ